MISQISLLHYLAPIILPKTNQPISKDHSLAKTMKRLLLTLCLLTIAQCVVAKDLVIVADGKSDHVIAVSEQSKAPAKITEAARLLQDCITKATGVELPVVKESEVAGSPAIYLGKTLAAQRIGLPMEDIKGWAYRMRVIDRNIYLVGEEDPAHKLVPKQQSYSGYSGTYKAVTTFLEDPVGVRFVLPGEMGVHVPKLNGLGVDANLNASWSPSFAFIGRRVSPYSGKHVYDPYAIANNYFGRYSSDSKTFWTGGSHTWNEFVPREKYLATHPEYFALFKGKRDFFKRNILCLSQPEVHDLLVEGVVKKFDAGYQMVMLGQADGYVECQCDACQAIHPDIGEKLWITHRRIAERLLKLRPGKQVVLSSYITTTKPPLSFTSFPTNVVIMNNRYSPTYFKAWENFPTPRVVFVPDWLRRWPRVPPRYAVDLIRLWRANNVIAVHLGGGLDQPGSSWGLNGLSYYAFLAKRWKIPLRTPTPWKGNTWKPPSARPRNPWRPSSPRCIAAWKPGNCSIATKPETPIVVIAATPLKCFRATITAISFRPRSCTKWSANSPAPRPLPRPTRPARASNWSKPSSATSTASPPSITSSGPTKSPRPARSSMPWKSGFKTTNAPTTGFIRMARHATPVAIANSAPRSTPVGPATAHWTKSAVRPSTMSRPSIGTSKNSARPANYHARSSNPESAAAKS